MSAKETQEILLRYASISREGKRAVLATLVQLSGSSYRRLGAHILVDEDGIYCGTISGACLEQDICQYALRLLKSNSTESMQLLRYDTSHDDDAILGFGSGCSGKITILLEVLETVSKTNPLKIYEECSSNLAGPSLLATVIYDGQKNESLFGQRFLIRRTDKEVSELSVSSLRNESTPELKYAIKEELERCTSAFSSVSANSFARIIKIQERKLVLFFKVIQPPQRLFIFGAGHDAPALVEAASALGMKVVVCDHRKALLNKDRFKNAESLVQVSPENSSSFPALNRSSCCLLMTHNYLVDKHLLFHLLQTELAYLGAIGPRRRSQRMLKELQESHPRMKIKTDLQAPAGLDIGADGPEQIAISILAEITAKLNRRSGGFLSARQAPIHEHPQDNPEIDPSETDMQAENLKCMQSRL